MGIRRGSTIFAITIAMCSTAFAVVEGYKNYTVGDSMGWYDSQVKPGVDYQKWASGKTFSLGDFLLFNTDNNHSVSLTYNQATYKSCSSNGDGDANEYSTSNPSSTSVYPVTVPVPLLKEGPTYFFSAFYDGDQCRNGQKFQITVTHGQGLPPSLLDEAGAPSPQPDADSGDDDDSSSTISADFSHPKNVTSSTDSGDDSNDEGGSSKESKSSGSPAAVAGEMRVLSVVVVLVGLSRFL